MVLCPNCGGELRLNAAAEYNAGAYDNRLTAIALCCGTGVVLQRVITIKVAPYRGSESHDDWGHKIKQIKTDGV